MGGRRESEQQFGEKRWRCMGRVTDAKFEEEKRREVVGRRGLRGGEVERKTQTCWGRLMQRWNGGCEGLDGWLEHRG